MYAVRAAPASEQMAGGSIQAPKSDSSNSPHPYLERKHISLAELQAACKCVVEIRSTALGSFRGPAVFRELLSVDGSAKGFERILPERISFDADSKPNDKFAQKDSKVSGTFTPIGFHPSELISMNGRVIVCAGLADGYRLHQATGDPVACGAGEGSVRSIAEAIQPLNSLILVAVDRDDAGKRYGATSGFEWAHPITDKDWSDVYQTHGLQSVRDQLAVDIKKSFQEAPSAAPSVIPSVADVTAPAQKLADSIHGQLLAMLAINAEDQPEKATSLKPNTENIVRIINGAFWSGSKSKLFLLNRNEILVQCRESDASKFLTETYGSVVDRAAVEHLARSGDFGSDPVKAAPARTKFVAGCMAVVKTAILDYLKYHNQRESVEWRVDMFANFSRLELLEEKARIVLAHKPLPSLDQPKDYDRIIADYKEHFSRFDAFLDFITMARFALDRKKAYLWILADSDWGKGFLTGVLAKLGVCVETSMKEVEAMLEGKPVGRSAEDFKRAFVLLIDEFKTVKSELKQLQSQITLSPKNQLACTVEVFAKVFTSAESVGSLVTENGVEDQFANRMSIFQETGDITKRPVYREVGGARYFPAVKAYTAAYLNNAIGAMQRMGREEAEAHAETGLNTFIKLYGLDTVYERFSDSLPELAQEIARYFIEGGGNSHSLVVNDLGAVYLRSPAKAVDDYLVEHYDQSQITAFRKKKNELIKLMSADGKGSIAHRINGEAVKAVKLDL